MSEARIDQMTYHVAETICRTDRNIADVPRELARKWPDAPALELVVAMALAAQGVQGFLSEDGPSGQRAQQVWQQAAVLASEIYYLTLKGHPNPTAQDLLDYWDREAEE